MHMFTNHLNTTVNRVYGPFRKIVQIETVKDGFVVLNY